MLSVNALLSQQQNLQKFSQHFEMALLGNIRWFSKPLNFLSTQKQWYYNQPH